MDIILITVLVLGVLGIAGAGVLYVVAKRFNVVEDPRVEQIEAILPGANCGGCGFSGCHDFAVNCARATSLSGFNCPGAGPSAMVRIGEIMGMAASTGPAMVAVVRCGGTCEKRPARVTYDGAMSCALIGTLGSGTTDCSYGCLGAGDCVAACQFDAIKMDLTTGLPVVDQDKCTGCSACVKACPRQIIELRNKGPKNLRVWVGCVNREKGPMAMKACKAACIACGKCFKVCPHEAITIADNVAYIDFKKCKLCRKCVPVCPTGAIQAVNFPTPIPQSAPKPQEDKQ